MSLENNSYEVLSPVISVCNKKGENAIACFLLTHVPNPRINKRIEVLKHFYDTKVICARRKKQNIWEPTQNVEHFVIDIDLPSSRQIVKRYFISQYFQKKAFEKIKSLRPDVIYAEGLDTLIIAGKYKKTQNVSIIFEVADVRENFIEKPRNIKERIITNLLLAKEKRAFQNVDYLVITSPKFYDIHYKELISKEKVLYIPNAPDLSVFNTYRKKTEGQFTIGFIGGIRYIQQMKMLVAAAEETGCNVLFAGAGDTTQADEEIREYCKSKPFVKFTGKYDYNTQIAELYGRIDCVFAVYDASNPNVRIALPNKLYESIQCELPIIVAKNTYLAELINEWGVGLAVDHNNKDELVTAINELIHNKTIYNNIVNNCKAQKGKIFC